MACDLHYNKYPSPERRVDKASPPQFCLPAYVLRAIGGIVSKTKSKYSSGGANGVYFQLNNRKGIKTVQSYNGEPEYFKTKREAQKSQWIDELELECKVQSEAYRRAPAVVCKPYGVKAIRLSQGWVVGIEMEHLGRVTLEDSGKNFDNVMFNLCEKLEKAGIYHHDLHENNVMVSKTRIKVIDFDPHLVAFDKEENIYAHQE